MTFNVFLIIVESCWPLAFSLPVSHDFRPQEIRPLSKGVDIPSNIAPGGGGDILGISPPQWGEYARIIAPL